MREGTPGRPRVMSSGSDDDPLLDPDKRHETLTPQYEWLYNSMERLRSYSSDVLERIGLSPHSSQLSSRTDSPRDSPRNKSPVSRMLSEEAATEAAAAASELSDLDRRAGRSSSARSTLGSRSVCAIG